MPKGIPCTIKGFIKYKFNDFIKIIIFFKKDILVND